jgi:hypothetical protein
MHPMFLLCHDEAVNSMDTRRLSTFFILYTPLDTAIGLNSLSICACLRVQLHY